MTEYDSGNIPDARDGRFGINLIYHVESSVPKPEKMSRHDNLTGKTGNYKKY
jgi:hypothetical protein